MKIITFRLSNDLYAVQLTAVSALLRPGEVYGGAAAEQMVPLDLHSRLGYPGAADPGGPILVLRADGRDAAIQVDAPGEVLDIDAGQVSDVPRFFDSELLRGVVEAEERLIVFLDEGALVLEAREGAAAAGRRDGGE